MVDLEVKFAGVSMRNPIGVASMATATGTGAKNEEPQPKAERLVEHLMRYVEAGAGFLVTPVIGLEEDYPQGRLPSSRCQAIEDSFARGEIFACANFYNNFYRLKEGLKAIRLLKERLPKKVPVVVNIIGPGGDPKGWTDLVERLEGAGADLIEMGVSIPFPATEAKAVELYRQEKLPPTLAGLMLADVPLRVAEIVKEIKKRVKIPIGVKFTPETGFPRLVGMAQVVKDAGASFITNVGGTLSIAPPDIYNSGKSTYPFLDGCNPIAAVSGPWNRYFVYKNTGIISKFVPGIDLAAAGGLVEHGHIIEAIMLGAKMIQLSSGIIWKGVDFLKSSIAFLQNYMKAYNYAKIDDLCGLGIKYIVAADEIDYKTGRVVAGTNPLKCTGCGICVDNICFVRYLEDNVAKVKEEGCHACGFCVALCPEKANFLKEV